MTALGVEKWRQAIQSNVGLAVEVEEVMERIVRIVTKQGVELGLAERYW
jgi:hypothetical protein